MDTQVHEESAIPRKSLVGAVTEKLRDKILRGEIKEGEQLRQHEIAASFQVSRIPVREALRELQAEGLITIVTHRGAVVSALSPEEIEELFEIRALLEPAVLRHSIPNLTEEHFRRAEMILEALEKAYEEQPDIFIWGKLNWDFHSTLYSAANRPRVLALIQAANNNANRYAGLFLLFSRNFDGAKEEHRAILELCQKRDIDKACRSLEEHIRNTGRSLSEYIERHRDKSATNSGLHRA